MNIYIKFENRQSNLALPVSLCAFSEMLRIKVVNEHCESCNCNVIQKS